MNASKNSKSWLSYFHLSDEYERKTRLIPGLLTIMFALPGTIAIGLPLSQWLTNLVAGVGVGAALSVGISYLASAMGNSLQTKIWPNWPHDSPTNQWLNPNNDLRSDQQRNIWYEAIRQLTNLDLGAAGQGNEQLEPLIEDAVSQLRPMVAKNARLVVHNADYGFVRNFTGLRPLWLVIASASVVACWVAYFARGANVLWATLATALAVLAFFLAFRILPGFVRTRAARYAESFFAAVLELANAER